MGGINDSPTWHYSMVVSDKTLLNYELKLGILDKGGYWSKAGFEKREFFVILELINNL